MPRRKGHNTKGKAHLRMPYAHAFVDNDAPMGLEVLNQMAGLVGFSLTVGRHRKNTLTAVPCSLKDSNTLLHGHLRIALVVRRVDAG